MTDIEVHAANVIKRSMRYNRDRHFYTLAKMGRSNISRDMILANLSVYSYTADVNYHSATMGCDMYLFNITEASVYREWITDNDYIKEELSRLAGMIDQYSIMGYSSKKIVRLVNTAMTLDELRITTGWHGDINDECRYAYPPKYIHMRDLLVSKVST